MKSINISHVVRSGVVHDRSGLVSSPCPTATRDWPRDSTFARPTGVPGRIEEEGHEGVVMILRG